jgi:diacylglycerol kinase (ATP)
MVQVLLNAAAGGGRADALVAPMRDWLRRHHPTVGLTRTVSAGEARRVIGEAARGSRIVVVGGDGTLHQLLPALLDGAHEVALVAAGSGDDSARALGLRGLAWPRALSRALLAESVAADIGWLTTTGSATPESRPFFSSLCAGFDAAVAQRAARGALRGLPRYLLATLAEVMALRRHTLRIEADDALLYEGEALFASSLNTASYGGGMPAVPSARIDDGALDLLLAKDLGRTGVLVMLPRLLMGWHLGHRRVLHRRFQKLRISASTALPLAADGEPLAAARELTLRVGAARLRIVPGVAFRRSGA